jgi:predicted NAD/FAD-binding protein
MNQRIAIIGGGVAGLTAGHLLHEKNDLILFEKSDRIGGNAYTLTTPDGQELDIAVAVFAKYSYKNFFKLLSKLNIKTVSTFGLNPLNAFGLGLGFCNLDSKEGLFITPGIKGLISQKFEILRFSHVNSILQLMHGLKRAKRLLGIGALAGLTIEETLKKIPHLTGDTKLIFVASLCLISSMYCDDVLNAPSSFFIEKLNVHDDLLPPKALFSLRLTKEGTKSYVEALSSGYKDKIIFNSNIATVIRQSNEVALVMENGEKLIFDKVVFACNADQALSLLEKPTEQEEKLLGAWKYNEGKIIVHADHAYFPKRELMEGYTFLYRDKGKYIDISISGSLWALPGASKNSNLISTQHPNFPIDEEHIVFEKVFRTPIFDSNSCSTTRDLPTLNGKENTYYCGSHFGFGLHEDAVTSAIKIAERLNTKNGITFDN